MKSKEQFSARNKESSPCRKLEETRVMNKSNGAVKGYSANTFQGLVRNYNEDRVSIILNISKPETQASWPKCSYFGVFDGHGGHRCSDFLRDNLHKYIIEDKNFPFNPISALRNGFAKAEKQFTKHALSLNPIDRSGSCAIILLIVDNRCFVANVGDSRAILSQNKGQIVSSLSIDHKPNAEGERSRIEKYGGTVYQSNIVNKKGEVISGPFRLMPGKLSVSRAIGDVEAKLQKFAGNPNVLIGDPQICQLSFDESHDFIMLGCDGIFDKLSNQQISDVIWNTHKKSENQSFFLKDAVSAVICEAMLKKSLDNLTVVLILLDGKSSGKKAAYPTNKDSILNRQKLETFQTQQLPRGNKYSKRDQSLDTNKQNMNSQNITQLTSQRNHQKLTSEFKNQTMKPNLYEHKSEFPSCKQKKYSTRDGFCYSKQLSVDKIDKIDKQGALRTKRRQSQNKKIQLIKNEVLSSKLKGLMRY